MVYNGSGNLNNNSGNDFTGIIYAANAQIQSDWHIKDAVAGKYVNMNNGSSVTLNSSTCF